MKVILVKESDNIRLMEGEGEVSETSLSLRSRLNPDIEYYELDYNSSLNNYSLDAYIKAINRYPSILKDSKFIRKL